jgi:hypothetical protein
LEEIFVELAILGDHMLNSEHLPQPVFSLSDCHLDLTLPDLLTPLVHQVLRKHALFLLGGLSHKLFLIVVVIFLILLFYFIQIEKMAVSLIKGILEA